MFALMLIVFISMVGFGVVYPMLPFFGEHVGADPGMIGWIIAAYGVGQFIGGPIWGRLSDTYGRRPILIISSALSVFPYLLLAVADNVTWLLVARVTAGIAGGNISTAFALAADIADSEERAKQMGRVTAAFGAGFFAGPALGGLFAGDSVETANFVLLSLVSAAVISFAFVAAVVSLPETLDEAHRRPLDLKFDGGMVRQDFVAFMGRRQLVAVIAVSFLLFQPGALVQAILPEWLHVFFGLGPLGISFTLGYVALIAFLMQSGFVGPLVKRVGEEQAARWSTIIYGLAFFLLIFADNMVTLYVSLTLIGIGFGIFGPSLQSLIARLSGVHEYGTVMGIQQSATSLSRITGPVFAWYVYGAFGGVSPLIAGVISVLPGVVLIFWATRPGAAAPHELTIGKKIDHV